MPTWMVMRGGAWTSADDNTVIAWIRDGSIGPATLIRNISWPGPQPLGTVPGFLHHLRSQPKRGMSTGLKVLLIGGCVLGAGGLAAAVLVGAAAGRRRADAVAARQAVAAAMSGCGTVDKWSVCITHVDRQPDPKRADHVILDVSVRISHSSHNSEYTFGLDFDVQSSDGDRYSVDDDASLEATLAGKQACGMLADQIHPKDAVDCLLVYSLPKDLDGNKFVIRTLEHEETTIELE